MIIQKLRSQIENKNKRNFFIYGLGQAFNLLSPLIVAPYIVSVCHEEGLGKSALGFAMALFLILIVDYAFDIKGTKAAAENRDNPEELRKLITTTIFTKIVLFAITLVIATVLIGGVPFLRQEKMLFFLSLPIVFAQVFNPVWFLQGLEKFPLVSAINICSKTMYVILIWCFVNHRDDYILVNLFLGTSSLIFNVAGLLIIKKTFSFKIIAPPFAEVTTILRKDFSFCISQLFLSVRQLSPLVLTGYFLGYHVAGQYKIMEQIVTFFRTFMQVYLKFFYPSVCYKILNSLSEGFAFWKKYTAANVGFVFVGLLTIFIFSEEVLRFFHASESSLSYLVPVFRLSLLVSLLMSANLPLEQLMFITAKNSIYIRITILVTVVNVSLILLLIHSLNLYGIIISLIVSEMLFIILYFYNSYLYLNHKIKE